MANRINIFGQLYVAVECAECGEIETVEVTVQQADWLGNLPIQAFIDPDDIKDSLEQLGWQEIGYNMYCPDCAAEKQNEI